MWYIIINLSTRFEDSLMKNEWYLSWSMFICQVASNNFSKRIICKIQECKSILYLIYAVRWTNYVLKDCVIFYYWRMIQDIVIFIVIFMLYYIYFWKRKEVLNYLKQFYTNVQADGHNLKILRINYDKEFSNKAIKNYLLSKNIKHKIMCTRNGFIDRQNRTIVGCSN